MKKLIPLLFTGFLVIGAAACESRTSTNAPDTTTNANTPAPAQETTQTNQTNANNQATQTPSKETVQANQRDATSDVRKRQIESDIRAREQRSNITGGDADRADTDLESQVRGKLEANIPGGDLEVKADQGAVTVTGTVPKQDQLAKIDPLSKQIKGVKSVKVNVKVAAAQ